MFQGAIVSREGDCSRPWTETDDGSRDYSVRCVENFQAGVSSCHAGGAVLFLSVLLFPVGVQQEKCMLSPAE